MVKFNTKSLTLILALGTFPAFMMPVIANGADKPQDPLEMGGRKKEGDAAANHGNHRVMFSVVDAEKGGAVVSANPDNLQQKRRKTHEQTSSPTPVPEFPCDDTKLLVEIDIKPDDNPLETIWTITGTCDGIVTRAGTITSYCGIENSEQVGEETCILVTDPNFNVSYCLPKEGRYTFTIIDTYGDGMCCDKGDGSYNLTVDGEIIKNGGNFGRSERTDFGTGPVCASASMNPTESPTKTPKDNTKTPKDNTKSTKSVVPSTSPSASPSVSVVPSTSPSASPSVSVVPSTSPSDSPSASMNPTKTPKGTKTPKSPKSS